MNKRAVRMTWVDAINWIVLKLSKRAARAQTHRLKRLLLINHRTGFKAVFSSSANIKPKLNNIHNNKIELLD